eukprot:993897-Lingulodinium_polyedra.AAC.1
MRGARLQAGPDGGIPPSRASLGPDVRHRRAGGGGAPLLGDGGNEGHADDQPFVVRAHQC